MDTYSGNNNDSENVVEIWSRNKNDSIISDDPLEDLLNEFGTESPDNQSFAWEEELLESLKEEDSDSDLMFEHPKVDYFYEQLEARQSNENGLDELSSLVHKAKYLSSKLKYYNTYLLNRE